MKLAVVQWNSSPEIAENLATLAHLLGQLPAERPMLVAIPEMFASFAGQAGNLLAIAEPLGEGPIARAVAALARQFQLWIVAGTIATTSDEAGRYYSSSLIFDDRGELRGDYQKIHLFDALVADGTGSYQESATTKPGTKLSVVDSPFGKIGQAICYDLRFAGLFSALVAQGADIIVLPSAFTVPTGEAHWQPLLQARAIETQCYWLAPDQAGEHANGRQTHGHSMIISPWGEVLAELAREPGVAVVEFDLAKLRGIRQKMPVSRHNQFTVSGPHSPEAAATEPKQILQR